MSNQHWRIEELKHHSKDISWLDASEASQAYTLVGLYDSKSHLGLNAQTVDSIERLELDEGISTATDWLRLRISGIQELVVVFGEDDCFRCSGNFFVENWSDIFVPARDDAMAYSPESSIILFYCHENEFELGQRIVFD
ncbi:hypothetical protein FXN63_07330 [Pigmentiphaga aceris]|uniref:Uncharacterized protein n=1 Tax=Pigmentiphaga aceris TaxID=1940612 RepID=A0A5C0AWC5_9BURK|nr:hypothetical protein [Pigmentiphaga aceris]QEI05673.1 hypothetical protein FXN63_07330 [Pigmentiphaga aceris]